MSTLPFSTDEIAAKGKAIFREKIRPTLTDADKGKYVIINTATGEYVLGTDYEETANRARAQFTVGQPQYAIRAGHRAVFSFRPGLNQELSEW